MTGCGSASQKALSAQVFVEVGPVDAITAAGNLLAVELFTSGL